MTPCGSSAAAGVLLRITVLTGNPEYAGLATKTLRSMRELMAKAPSGCAHWLCALDFYLSTPKEIAIVGNRDESATESLLTVIYRRYLPNKVLVGCEPGDNSGLRIPLLEGRSMVNGYPTAYVCERYSCQRPVSTPEALARELEPAESQEYRGA